MNRPGITFLFLVALFASTWHTAAARSERRVEVVEVQGIIDAPVEHAIKRALRDGARENAQLVVVQLDSLGTVGQDRASDLLDRIHGSRVPVVVWIPPGGRAENSAAVIAMAAHYTAMGPGARIGPIRTDDLSGRSGEASIRTLKAFSAAANRRIPFERSIGPSTAKKQRVSDGLATAVTDLLEQVDGKALRVGTKTVRPSVDPAHTEIRFQKLGLIGGILHAAAKPSITYLLLLVGLVGIVFELFHPSTGPAGFAGVVSVALAVYGMLQLGGSWAAFAAILFAVAMFTLDLAREYLGVLSIGGFVLLTGASIFLFPGPYLRASPYVIAFGVIAMTMFLVGAMTRVLRDLRAIERGDLEVKDAHPHPDGHGG